MEAAPTKVIEYFSGFKQNLVPLFQRPYSWEQRHWKTLWDDILEFYGPEDGHPTSTHFMGAVVTMPARSVPVGVSKFLVIDGQQRLTTVAAILCAIRDQLGPAEVGLKRRIQNHYLINEGYEDLDAFKLLPTQADRGPYTNLILDSGTAAPDSQFTKAYRYFQRQLRGRDDDGAPLDTKRILAIIETRLMVVMINLGESDDPYSIFESLNFKGLPLEQADLVRNYFMMRFPAGDQKTVFDELWLPMQNQLGVVLTEFMRHFLGAEGEEIRKGDVYVAIKRLVANADTSAVRGLMTRMAALSVFYSRLAGVAAEPDTEIAKYLARFRQLDFGSVYPLLLSLYEDYDDELFEKDEFIASLQVLESYIIRRMVLRVPSNSLPGTFIALCRTKAADAAPSGWLSGALAAEDKNRRWPTDAEFSTGWITADIYSSPACRVILECLEENYGHHERIALTDLSVEHVLPQTLSSEWKTALGADAATIHSKWLHTIGNLTLTGYNPELSNRDYSAKQALFAASHIELNRYFGDCPTWGPGDIQRRAEALLGCALEMWPRPAATPDDPAPQSSAAPAAFHNQCVHVAEAHLGIVLSKLSQTRYEAGDMGTRVVCAVSGEHNEAGETPFFWFSFHRKQLDFLDEAKSAWLILGCGSAHQTLIIPLPVIRPLLPQMSVTAGDTRQYWHVVIQRKSGKLVLRLRGGLDGPDLTEFLISLPDRAQSA